MNEMLEVVIKIPKNIYESLYDPFDEMWKHYLVACGYAIRHGTVLPKGHGRLVDADAILEDPYGNTYKDIDIAETIIEADKEGSE